MVQGDEVVTFEPYFDAYKTVSTLLGLQTAGVPLELTPVKQAAFAAPASGITTPTAFSSADFRVDIDKLERAITPATKMLVLNTPHNPTGKVFAKAELEQIAQVLARHPHVLVLADEVYEFMAFDGLPHERFAALPGMFDRTISLFSAGKTFSCTGWRVGYAVAPAHLTTAITKAHSTVPFCGTTPFEVAMASCFTQVRTNGYLDELKATLEVRAAWVPVGLTTWMGYTGCSHTHILTGQARPARRRSERCQLASNCARGGLLCLLQRGAPPGLQRVREHRGHAGASQDRACSISGCVWGPWLSVCCVVTDSTVSSILCVGVVSSPLAWAVQEYPDYQFAYKLCKEHKLAVIPTSPFFTRPEHMLGPGVVRLAFCKDDKTLDDAIRVIESVAA